MVEAVCREEQLLGEMDTEIEVTPYRELAVEPAEPVSLEREPHNPHDRKAIHIANRRFDTVGCLPQEVACWLAPLLDAGWIRVEGYVAKHFDPGSLDGCERIPLVLTVYATPNRPYLFAKESPRNKLDVMHEVVRKAYLEAQQFHNTRLLEEMAEGLRPLKQQELLPETHLLMALLPGLHREIVQVEGMRTLVQLRGRLAALSIGDPAHYQGLSVFPLLWPECAPLPYVLLAKAVAEGTAVVEEVSEGGSVPELRLKNAGDCPVLVPEGEILVGAKQNRVVNVTVLVAAKSTLSLPVSCVEQGRWHYKTRHFQPSYCAPPSLRSKKMRSVQRNRDARGKAHSDQGEVWQEVNRCLSDLNAQSPTDSLTDGFDSARQRLHEYRQNLEIPRSAVGVVVAHGSQIVGLDLFGSAETFATLWERFSDAYFFDALRKPPCGNAVPHEAARALLDRIAARAKPRRTSIGLGAELEIHDDALVGAALLYEGHICHLSAFSEGEE